MEARRSETEVVEPGRREPAVAAAPAAIDDPGARDFKFGAGTLILVALAAVVAGIILSIT
jgi:hypothetical protein